MLQEAQIYFYFIFLEEEKSEPIYQPCVHDYHDGKHVFLSLNSEFLYKIEKLLDCQHTSMIMHTSLSLYADLKKDRLERTLILTPFTVDACASPVLMEFMKKSDRFFVRSVKDEDTGIHTHIEGMPLGCIAYK